MPGAFLILHSNFIIKYEIRDSEPRSIESKKCLFKILQYEAKVMCGRSSQNSKDFRAQH